MAGSADPVLTIGHSNHGMERFLELLHRHQVRITIDVRAVPHTRFVPRFNRTTSGGCGTAGRTHGDSPPTRGKGGLTGDGRPQAGIDLSRKEPSIPS